MKAEINRMIKEILIEGFRKSKFVLEKTTIEYPRGGFFTRRQDMDRAYQIASMNLETWQARKKSGINDLPPTFEEFKRFLDILIAERSFEEAWVCTHLQFCDRSFPELVKEMQGAIDELKRLGGSKELARFEFYMEGFKGED
jgi:hypothetical protein